jgi:uncharacterized protein YegJ (DUF2314 family)
MGSFARVTSLLILTALVACDMSGQRPPVAVEPDDPAMVAAIQMARDSIERFREHLQTSGPTGPVSLKVSLTEGDQVEHAWLAEVHENGVGFWGRINNELVAVTRWKLGDSVTVGLQDVSEWMVVKDGRLIGGYSIRVLRDKMSPSERAEFDRGLPFKIE